MTSTGSLRLAERTAASAARSGHVAVFLYADGLSKRVNVKGSIARMIATGGSAGVGERQIASVLAGAARQPGYLAEQDEQRAAVAAIGLAVLQGLGSRVNDGITLHVDLARDCDGWHGTCQIGEHRAASREPEKLPQPSVRPGEVLCSFLAHCRPVVELQAPGEEIHRLGAAWRPEDVPSRFNVHGLGDHDALTQTALARLVLAGQDAATAQAPAVLGALGWVVGREGARWSDALRRGSTHAVVNLFRDGLYSTARWRFEPIRVETPPEPEPMPELEPRCAHCGAPSTTARADARYCSGRCRQSAYRKRKAARCTQ